MVQVICKLCHKEIFPSTEHVCPGCAPLYGTAEYAKLDPRTLAAHSAHKWARALRDCQAFRWGAPGCTLEGDAIVQYGLAIVRTGNEVHVIQGPTEDVCLNYALDRLGVDRAKLQFPLYLEGPFDDIEPFATDGVFMWPEWDAT